MGPSSVSEEAAWVLGVRVDPGSGELVLLESRLCVWVWERGRVCTQRDQRSKSRDWGDESRGGWASAVVGQKAKQWPQSDMSLVVGWCGGSSGTLRPAKSGVCGHGRIWELGALGSPEVSLQLHGGEDGVA